MRVPNRAARRNPEGGFALILAILALMLLTTMGITLSLTTSTELQIANNYKWSQQALYNAEAGMEAGKRLLQTMDWGTILPGPRGSWTETSPATINHPTVPFGAGPRDFENGDCDGRGAGMGYGVVLNNGSTRYLNVDSVWGQTLRGAFTLWVRRRIVMKQDGNFEDSAADDNSLVLVSEGVAPYTTMVNATGATRARIEANRAVRVMEWTLSRTLQQCGTRAGQSEGGPEGGGPGACKTADNSTMDKMLQQQGGTGTGDQVGGGAGL